MSELTVNEATALMAAGMYASPPTEAQMKDGIERAESWLAQREREVKAEAWEEGHSWGWSDAQEAHDVRQEMDRSEWRLCTPNPYRIESQETP